MWFYLWSPSVWPFKYKWSTVRKFSLLVVNMHVHVTCTWNTNDNSFSVRIWKRGRGLLHDISINPKETFIVPRVEKDCWWVLPWQHNINKICTFCGPWLHSLSSQTARKAVYYIRENNCHGYVLLQTTQDKPCHLRFLKHRFCAPRICFSFKAIL